MTEQENGARSTSLSELFEMSDALEMRARRMRETDAAHSVRLQSLLALSDKVTESASRLRKESLRGGGLRTEGPDQNAEPQKLSSTVRSEDHL